MKEKAGRIEQVSTQYLVPAFTNIGSKPRFSRAFSMEYEPLTVKKRKFLSEHTAKDILKSVAVKLLYLFIFIPWRATGLSLQTIILCFSAMHAFSGCSEN
jgi:hypothetical protein